MQKETDTFKNNADGEISAERTMSENIPINNSDDSTDVSVAQPKEDATSLQNPSENIGAMPTDADFEDLIKGPYKAAFAKKVQSIINKRFKEQKNVENKSTNSNLREENSQNIHQAANKQEKTSNVSDLTYNSLIEAGVDPETAYRVLHLDEIMDSSMRYGAELAAKHLADNIRQKAARPTESALTEKGYSAKISAHSLTPEKRRELAKKALMGEQIGF